MDQSLKYREALLFGFGVVVAVHVVNWFAISYFDQSYAVWYFQLACIIGICHAVPMHEQADEKSPKISGL